MMHFQINLNNTFKNCECKKLFNLTFWLLWTQHSVAKKHQIKAFLHPFYPLVYGFDHKREWSGFSACYLKGFWEDGGVEWLPWRTEFLFENTVIVREDKNSLTKEISWETNSLSDLVAWESKLLRLAARPAHCMQGGVKLIFLVAFMSQRKAESIMKINPQK